MHSDRLPQVNREDTAFEFNLQESTLPAVPSVDDVRLVITHDLDPDLLFEKVLVYSQLQDRPAVFAKYVTADLQAQDEDRRCLAVAALAEMECSPEFVLTQLLRHALSRKESDSSWRAKALVLGLLENVDQGELSGSYADANREFLLRSEIPGDPMQEVIRLEGLHALSNRTAKVTQLLCKGALEGDSNLCCRYLFGSRERPLDLSSLYSELEAGPLPLSRRALQSIYARLAAEKDGPIVPEWLREQIVEATESVDAGLRFDGVLALGVAGNTPALTEQVLVRALSDPAANVRDAAALSLCCPAFTVKDPLAAWNALSSCLMKRRAEGASLEYLQVYGLALRGLAMSRLTETGPAKSLDDDTRIQLAELARSADDNFIKAALWGIALHGENSGELLPELHLHSNSSDPELIALAHMAMVLLKQEAAPLREQLYKALGNADAHVHHLSILSLSKIGESGPRYFDMLHRQFAAGDELVQRAVLFALLELEQAPADFEPEMTQLIRGADLELVKGGMAYLWRSGVHNMQTKEALLKLLHSPNVDISAAAEALLGKDN